MSGLVLKLRPFEELLINGVLVENGDRNARLRVKTDGAHILRLKDALKPEDATTPARRAYYVAQLAVAGQMAAANAASLLTEMLKAEPSLGAHADLGGCIVKRDFYQVMRRLREAAFADRPGPVAREGVRTAAAV